MRRLLPWLLFVVAAAVLIAYALQRGIGGIAAPVERHDPRPGDPPVVWVSGRIVAVDAERVVVRSGEGPRVRLERLAGDATAVFRRAGGGWTEIPPEEGLERGADACVEALLDETVFVALRVFLGAEGCGPV